MAFRMARPWRDPKTGVLHLRQRTPRDLFERVRGQMVSLPIGDDLATVKIGVVVQVSLRTRDAVEAKARHASADAALKKLWEAQRHGPVRLTHRQAVALAGTLYRQAVSAFESEPTAAATIRWAEEQGYEIGAASRDKLLGGRGSDEIWAKLADELLAREALVIDDLSRSMLINEVRSAVVDAVVRTNRSYREGDYRPDETVKRFPEWTGYCQNQHASGGELVTVHELFRRWSKDQSTIKAPGTIDRYGPSLRSLADFVGERDVRSLTPDDIFAWAEAST